MSDKLLKLAQSTPWELSGAESEEASTGLAP